MATKKRKQTPENRGKQASKTKSPKVSASGAPRANAGQFQKGRSGNPGGRPKTVGVVRELAQEFNADMINTLVDIALNKEMDPRARVAAAKEVLDRGNGKAPQSLEVSGPGGKPLIPTLSLKDLSDGTLQQLEEALALAEAEAARAATFAESSTGGAEPGPARDAPGDAADPR